MKIQPLIAASVICALIFQPSISHAQGALTPSGAPAPTMKSLAQIEPRTPISSLPFTISSAGSYYVTSNLSPGINENGIIVAADNVTIDLNGFTLFGGGGGSGEAIWAQTARANIVVRNGTVRNWPGSGVNFYDSGSSQVILQNLRSISNGFTGIAVKNGSRVTDCVVVGNSLRGVLVDNDCTVENCKVSGNPGNGLGAGATCQLLNNQCTGNGTGLIITGSGNTVANNTVKSNTDNYNIAQGNQLDLLLCELPESIDWPAHVKLAGSLNVTGTNCVTITANGVTLDLNGFTISSTAPSAAGTGILLANVAGNNDITILNGHIRGGVIYNGSVYSGPGFANGIYYSSAAPHNIRVNGVSVTGCQSYGIFLGRADSTVVESCSTQNIGSYGMYASVVSHSTAYQCGSTAIFADTVMDCTSSSTGGEGIRAITAQNCYGSSSASTGVNASTVLNCYGYTSGTGSVGLSGNIAQNCYGNANSIGFAGGVYVNNAQNCYGVCVDAGAGLTGYYSAIGCYGESQNGVGLSAFIADSCHGVSFHGTSLSVVHNVNTY